MDDVVKRVRARLTHYEARASDALTTSQREYAQNEASFLRDTLARLEAAEKMAEALTNIANYDDGTPKIGMSNTCGHQRATARAALAEWNATKEKKDDQKRD